MKDKTIFPTLQDTVDCPHGKSNTKNVTALLTVGDIVSILPQSMSVFVRNRIDYCCRNNNRLIDICYETGLDSAYLIHEICSEPRGIQLAFSWDTANLAYMIDFLANKHHSYFRIYLEDLRQLLDLVLHMHMSGPDHAQLTEIRNLYSLLHDDLLRHFLKEENQTFPCLMALDSNLPTRPPFDSTENVIRELAMEHKDDAGIMLRMLEITNNFTPPPEARSSFSSLYKGLYRLIEDIMQHIFLENHYLFKSAQAGIQREVHSSRKGGL